MHRRSLATTSPRNIHYTGHVKYPALAAIPIYLLGTSLIVYFRVPGAYVGRKMVIVGSALIPLTIICVAVWRNINVKELEEDEKRQRGNVF